MKHTQRQYAIKRLQEIYNVKVANLQVAFARSESARDDVHFPVVHPKYPSIFEIVQRIDGADNGVVLKSDYKQNLNVFQSGNSHYLYENMVGPTLTEPTNAPDVEVYKAKLALKTARTKAQVEDKINLLKVKLQESNDALMLGGEEEAMAALAAFSSFEV
jgi:hypothetical protein